MNSLAERFGSDLAVIGFPTNQFGHQTNEKEFEILNTLAHVRPGGGYKPNFPMMGKIDVNGENAHPLFQYLRDTLPTVSDDCASSNLIAATERRGAWARGRLRRGARASGDRGRCTWCS